MKYIDLPVPEELKGVFGRVVLGDDGSVSVAWAADRIVSEVDIGRPETGAQHQLLLNPLLGRVLFVRTLSS